jgi:hypothetical protein
MINSHEDEYEDSLENDQAQVRLEVNGNDTVPFYPSLLGV